MIFVDASAFIALVRRNDLDHAQALAWWSDQSGRILTTSNLVVIETLGWIRHKMGKEVAVKVGEQIFAGSGLVIERVTLKDEREAWKIFQKLTGRGVSMVDCTTMVVMKREGWVQIFTFDGDFEQAGFEVMPK